MAEVGQPTAVEGRDTASDGTKTASRGCDPELWQAMEPEQKRAAVEIVNKHNGAWSVDCMKELVDKLTVFLSDLPSIQVAIWHSIENPAGPDCGMKDEDDSTTSTEKNQR